MADGPLPKVLYVDDEEGNLVVFRATFKKHADVRTASSGARGLEILAREEIPVVISDQRMPGMSGPDFLAEVRRLYPDTMRMVLTAYTTFEDVVAAINRGQVCRFISKPWDATDLLATIVNAAAHYETTKENRRLSRHLLHAERLAAIGQVTSGFVHELGNIAGLLALVDEALHAEWKPAEPLRELSMLSSCVSRFSLLIETLRLYSKGGRQDIGLTFERNDLNDVVRSIAALLRLLPAVGQLRAFEIVPAPSPLWANVDAKAIDQILMNLVKNAAEACAASGVGTVRVTLERDGDRARIHVRDNGPGVPPEVVEQIFAGFYTSKGDRGTGLGLMVSRQIAEAHGGRLDHVSGVAGGSIFTLELPVRPDPA
jgi:C4-dicarboxylate-specific signal transduction histidine kinase